MNDTNIKKDFPILTRKVNGEPLVYLDNAATSQKPNEVIEKINHFLLHDNANVHRGVSTTSQEATQKYETARAVVAKFINANQNKEIIFTRSTTESLNLVAFGYADNILNANDEIVIAITEHHSNLIPWQQVAKRNHAKLRYIYLDSDGKLDLKQAQKLISNRTKIVSVAQVSNVIGLENPIQELSQLAHNHNAIMIVDAAQSAPHQKIDVQALDADFLAFSGHKMLAPTGIGVLYGKASLLEKVIPQQFGGEMIDDVAEQSATFTDIPLRLEAGTPNISGAIGLHAAVNYLTKVGIENIHKHDQELAYRCIQELKKISGITIYGSDIKHHNGVVTFNLSGVHPHDVATGLDMEGIEVRAGHHCAQPLMKYIGVESTVRVSFYFYNDLQDVKKFITALKLVKEFFGNGTI